MAYMIDLIYAHAVAALPANQEILQRFLWAGEFTLWEPVLAGVNPFVPPGVGVDIGEMIKTFTDQEEKRMEEYLDTIAYEIDSTLTLQLICGSKRIEKVGIIPTPPNSVELRALGSIPSSLPFAQTATRNLLGCRAGATSSQGARFAAALTPNHLLGCAGANSAACL